MSLFSKYPLQKRILITISILIFLPYLALSTFISSYFVQAETERNRQQYLTLLHTAELAVNRSLIQVESVVDTLAGTESIRLTLKQKDWEETALRLLFSASGDLAKGQVFLQAYGGAIYLISPQEDLHDRYGQLYRQSHYKGDEELTAFLEGNKLSLWTGPRPGTVSGNFPLYTTGSEPVLCYCYKVNDSLFESVGAVLCSVKIESVFTPLQELSAHGVVRVYQEGRCVYEYRENSGQMFPKTAKPENGSVVFNTENTEYPFQFSLEVPADRIRPANSYYTTIPILIIVFYAAVMALIVGIIRILLKKLNLISRLMSVVNLEEDGQRLPSLGNDEIGGLARSINKLLGKVEQQRHEILKKEKDKRMAERYALQFQMNPHLLFNSLHWLQLNLTSRDRKLQEGVFLLGELYRYNLTGGGMASVQEELWNVQAYTEMMRLLKNSEIVLQADCPEELFPVRIPRFTLQPIAENAVKYGLCQGAPLHLRVSIQTEEAGIHILVENDGIPIGEEKEEEWNRAFSQDFPKGAAEHIGLLNLSRRLQLSFGGEAAVHIGQAGGSTQVSIRIPYESQAGDL